MVFAQNIFGLRLDKQVKWFVRSEGLSNRNRLLGGAERAQTNPKQQKYLPILRDNPKD